MNWIPGDRQKGLQEKSLHLPNCVCPVRTTSDHLPPNKLFETTAVDSEVGLHTSKCWVDLWVLRRSGFFKQIILHVNKVNIFIVKCALTLSVSGNTVPTKWLLNGKEGGVPRHYGASFCCWAPSWHRQHSARSERICCITHWLYQVRSGTLQINFLSRYFWTSALNQADKEHLWL